MSKIYDCFQFFNELDLLEIRLELLYDHVDHFVISETNRTHADGPKKMYFEENKEYFKKYLDKIIHIKTDYPIDILNMGKKEGSDIHTMQYNKISERYDIEENEGQLKKYPTFCRDYLQKEFLKYGLMDCDDDDIIMISDLDEIPNPDVVDDIRKNNKTNCCILQDCMYYHINTMIHTNWFGNYIVKYSDTKDVSLTHLKRERTTETFERIFKGGWHLSFMGGAERVKIKMESYAHQEFNHPYYKDNIQNKIDSGQDLFGRPPYVGGDAVIQEFYFNKMVDVDLSIYPDKMIDLIKQKYPYLIK